MSKFWQKKYISKYTGEEIDAAVAAGSQVPEITVEDAGRILGVDAEGKIVAKDQPLPENAATGSVMVKTADSWQAVTENGTHPVSRLLWRTNDDINNHVTIFVNVTNGDSQKTNEPVFSTAIIDKNNSDFFEISGLSYNGYDFTNTPKVGRCYLLSDDVNTTIATALTTALSTVLSSGSDTISLTLDPTTYPDVYASINACINENYVTVYEPRRLDTKYNNVSISLLNFMKIPTYVSTMPEVAASGIDASVSGVTYLSLNAYSAIVKLEFIFVLNSLNVDVTIHATKM